MQAACLLKRQRIRYVSRYSARTMFESKWKDDAVLCTISPLKVLTCASTTHRRQAASAASRLQGLRVPAMPAKLEASLPGRATIAEIRSFASWLQAIAVF